MILSSDSGTVTKSRVLVTGANRGIGLALTREFAGRGHTVWAGIRSPANAAVLDTLAAECPPARIRRLTLDVTQEASVRAAAQEFAEHAGGLDVLINNAAVFPEQGDEPFETIDPAWFRLAFETNVIGVVRVCQAFLPHLRRGKRPRVINLSSGAGSIGSKTDSRRYCYGTSKAALNMLTRTLAHELARSQITVAAISPGWVRTDMGGPAAELSLEESAESLATTIERLEPGQAGLFLDRHGDPNVYVW